MKDGETVKIGVDFDGTIETLNQRMDFKLTSARRPGGAAAY
jgi:hypothetical protein